MLRASSTLGFFLIFCFCQAQSPLRGKVVDSQTKEALPFVNISLEGTTIGTTTDINGRYELPSFPDRPVRISYVGYRTLHLTPTEFQKKYKLILLEESATELEGVTVFAGENPAHKIVRKATANREINDPENLSSFRYHAYHKFYATLEGTHPNDTAALVKFLENSHFFVNESVSERQYIKPNLDKEVITGNRMSGVKDPFFAILSSSFQPFTFYKDHITLLEKNFRNPISPGSIGKYDYMLIDTLYRGSDTTYIIQFEPLQGKIFDALKGQLYINTNGYALEYVLAQPADEQSLMTISIQQQYNFIHGHWFPKQLNTEFLLKENKLKGRSIQYIHSSYISNPEINIELPKKEFDLLNIEFAPNANRQDETFWKRERIDSLSIKETNTYKLYDSLKTQLAFLNTSMDMMKAITIGKIKWGKFYLPLEHLLRLNKYEGIRVGFGLQTGESISKLFQWEGYAAYGFRDRAMKYGGAWQVNLWRRRDMGLRFSYKQDVLEPGNPNFIKSPLPASGGQSFRNWMTSRMDSMQQIKAQLTIRPFRFSQVSFFAQQQKHNPAYAYSYIHPSDGEPRYYFALAETGMQVRIAVRESYSQIGNMMVPTSASYPQINLSLSKAWEGVADGEYSFTKAEVSIDHKFVTRGFGQTSVQLASGILRGDAPYPFLFNGKGSNFFDGSFLNSFMVPSYFQTMGLYEFLSDQYTYLFISHNFGRLTGNKSKYIRPELSVIHNMGIGSLQNPSVHQSIEFNTMEKGFLESGLMLTNLFRFKYLKTLYYGVGAGVFYRYGPYSFERESKNISTKLALTFAF